MEDFVKRGSVQLVKQSSVQIKQAAKEVRGSFTHTTRHNKFETPIIIRQIYYVYIDINNIMSRLFIHREQKELDQC